MKRLPKFSGLFCTMLLALGALAVLTTNPAPVLAQTCGVIVGMSKSCDTPKIVGEKVDCTITLTNNDACGNTYQINSGSDIIHASGGDVTDSGLPISAASPGTPASGTPCAVGDPPTLPCTVAPGGSVTFRDNDYTIVAGDVGSLNDQGTINMTDLCDNNTNGCSSTALDENASASTTVQSCSVAIDKQISCDEGATWTNADAASTGVVTGTCTGFSGDPIWVRYVVHNSGDIALTSCNVHDVTGTTPSSSGGTEYTQDYSTGLDNIASGATVTTPEITVGSDGSTPLACDSAGPNNDTAQVDCTCGGTSVGVSDFDTATFSCESCSVQIDKQVNCASAGYVDVFSSDDSVNTDTPPTADTTVDTCTGFNAYSGHSADNIAVQYIVTNTGDDDLENCSTSETNTAITGSATITGTPASIASGASASTLGPFNNDCSPSLVAEEVGGEDTATIGCDCAALENNTKTRSVGFHDTAGFSCLAPGLNVTKVCTQQSGGVNDFTIDVHNSGAVDLSNCTVSDAYLSGVNCPVDFTGQTPTDATSSLDATTISSLASGADASTIHGSISGLSANACNQASVTCDITGTAEQITGTSQDTCEVAFGCETRTPGYWKTHPEVAYSVMQAAGGAIQSCGLNLDNVLANNDCSAIEDMCSLGKDAAKLGIDPTQANLIFQCAAAELNLAVTQQDSGNCGNTIPNSTLTFDQCCGLTSACATADTANLYACQQAVSAFNAQYDTVTLDPGSVLNTPGANSSNCREANGNLIVNDPTAIGSSVADCGGARMYLQKSTGGGPGPASTTNNGKHKGQN